MCFGIVVTFFYLVLQFLFRPHSLPADVYGGGSLTEEQVLWFFGATVRFNLWSLSSVWGKHTHTSSLFSSLFT